MTLTLEPNAVVGGRYRLLRFLGRGGMGEVWAAEQTVTGMQVAMKFLIGGADAGSASTKRRFLREARAACAVSHPNVVQIYDVIELEEGIPAMVMELLLGESLEAKLSRDGKLSPQETVAVMARVVSAVGTAHTHGVVHRDLKPDNIFLVETPDGTNVKVLDFGIAKMGATEDGSQTGALTATGTMLGTPFYMSPEQAFGEKNIDHRADIWSLGIVMFRCLTGTLPTQAENLGQILKIIMTQSIPKVAQLALSAPAELTAMVDKMLAYAAKDRPADLREVKEVLDRLASEKAGDFGPPNVEVLAAVAPDAEAGDVSPGPLASGGLTSDGVASTTPRAPSKRVPLAVFALGGAVLLSLVTVGVVLGKHDEPAPEGSSVFSAVTSAPAGGSAVASSRALPSASASASVVAPAASSTALSVPSVAAAAPGRPSSKPSPGLTAPPPPTTAPTSLGGIVTENPFQK